MFFKQQPEVPFESILMEIESGLKKIYEQQPELTDTLCAYALDQAVVAVKQQAGFAKNEKLVKNPQTSAIIQHCCELATRYVGNIDGLTLKEYTALIAKVKRSVTRHSAYGARGYYDFISEFV